MTTPPSSAPDAIPLPPARQLAILYALIGLCCAIELVLLLSDWGVLPLPRLRAWAYENAGFWPGLMGPWVPNYAAQPYTMFLTYAVLHSGPLHLVFNMITLFSLGQAVIARVGAWGFVLLFASAVLGGALGYGLLANAPNPMVGASGGLFGLAGGILAWNYVDRFAAARTRWPVVQAGLALVALNAALWWLMDGHLAWETHLGGFVSGWVAALLIDPRGAP